MEHVNNDMDDLFQKAGDLYPLKTSESDWEGVQVKLKAEGLGEPEAVPALGRESRKKRRWLFLLLLIPVALGSAIYFFPAHQNQSSSAVSHAGKNPDDLKTEKTNPPVPAIQSPETDKAVSESPYAGKNNPSESHMKAPAAATGTGSGHNGTVVHLTTPENNSTENRNRSRPGTAEEKSPDGNTLSAVVAGTESNALFEPGIKPLSLTVVRPDQNILVAAAGLKQKDLNTAMTTAKKKTKTTVPVSKGFYAGIFGGPDFSTVHFQSVKNIGFGIGVQVGYRFNNRFALESGLIWDKKYYYTSGEYFDKSKTPISPTEEILNLNGYCNMFEIPLDLRYDIARKADHGYFVKAGFSSYLMKKEHYQINAINLGWNVSYPGTYHNTGNYFFSILQLSGGYEHQIGTKTNIRIEPYIKIPLQGIGIGNMPISSAGLYIGISHLFR